MSMRLIRETRNTVTGALVRIQRDRALREYRVRLVGRPQADYYTEDLEDAKGTAEAMAGEGELMHYSQA